MDRDAVRARYATRADRFRAERDALDRRSSAIANARLVAAVAALAGLIGGLWDLDAPQVWAVTGGGVAALGYIALALWHDREIRALDRTRTLLAINEAAQTRLDREWRSLEPVPPIDPVLARDPLAVDLDLMTHDGQGASLLSLLGTVHTPWGRRELAAWLLSPAAPELIAARQQAVDELAPDLDWRHSLEASARAAARSPVDPGPFLEWAESAPWMRARPLRLWLARALTAVTLVSLVLPAAELVPTSAFAVTVLLAAVNLAFTMLLGREIRAIFSRVFARERAFRHYAGLLELVASTPRKAERLEALRSVLTADGRFAPQQMRELDRLSGLIAVSSSMLYLPLQCLLLWDFHVMWRLECWQHSLGPRARGWLEALGQVEALSALAGLRHDHPEGCFPDVRADTGRLEARALAHPLLRPEDCVTNDVAIGPAGSFLLVTGSNMSGKSTLLRAIGQNVVLALAGGPVFARSMTLPAAALCTSFRVQDSLETGVSFFMAELQRLKQIVDRARQRGASESPALFLLDEVLQGTNVTERQIAVRRVLGFLLEQGAIGAVSTHDLGLAEAEGLREACRPVHFTESYEEGEQGPQMRFDYTLRDGVAPTVNALKLLEIVGLGEPGL